MTKAYLVWWDNGERYIEDRIYKVVAVFSTEEKATAYMTEWREKYRKESKEHYDRHIDAFSYGDFEEIFEDDFREYVYMEEHNIQ